ncbi:MAG TPA: hypothetical protein VJ888_02640 [Mobilitalea sp.]|nr:hypothetical protein [Mobilitalea sp.]
MKIIVYFTILIIFALWLNYEIHKISRIDKKKNDQFWKNERLANLSRRTNISGLEYITIPLDTLPMSDVEDSTINSYRDIIRSLSDKMIVNLTGLTNTDLKLKYGVANLNLLSEYDNNYTILVSMLHKWGERLYNKGYIKEAIPVLEYSVMCLTDVRKTYLLLAKIYMEQNTPEQIDPLLDILPFTKIVRKDKLSEELVRIKNLLY